MRNWFCLLKYTVFLKKKTQVQCFFSVKSTSGLDKVRDSLEFQDSLSSNAIELHGKLNEVDSVILGSNSVKFSGFSITTRLEELRDTVLLNEENVHEMQAQIVKDLYNISYFYENGENLGELSIIDIIEVILVITYRLMKTQSSIIIVHEKTLTG